MLFLFIILIFMYFTIFQYGEYDGHNQLFKFIFKQTPVESSRRQNSNFIWCNKGSFHKMFFSYLRGF